MIITSSSSNSFALYFQYIQYISIFSFLEIPRTLTITQLFQQSIRNIFFGFFSTKSLRQSIHSTNNNYELVLHPAVDNEIVLLNLIKIFPIIGFFYALYGAVTILSKIKDSRILMLLKLKLETEWQIRLLLIFYMNILIISIYPISNVKLLVISAYRFFVYIFFSFSSELNAFKYYFILYMFGNCHSVHLLGKKQK